MGTQFRIVLFASNKDIAESAFRAAFRRVNHLNQIFSDYDANSELSRLSQRAPTKEPLEVSEELWSVLRRSQQISSLTESAFDITVGPLSKLWRRARRQRRLPDSERLAEALSAVGPAKIKLDESGRRVHLLTPNMRLDLGGIAKGYAADAALAELRKCGVHRALVDAGGDILVGSAPPGEKGWRIGIRAIAKHGTPESFVVIANRAIATSGDAWQFVEIDGRRYSHIIDPKTGIGLTTRVAATVLADDCMTADALATAFCVLGPEKSVALADEWGGVEVILAVPNNESVRTFQSSCFSVSRLDE
jgi:thiamine biosynthesis lipoprotein